MSLKNKILIFILHSTSDDRPSDLSDKSRLKCKKGPLSHQKMKCSFLDCVQLLMISQVIQVIKVDQNAKKSNVLIRVFRCFSLGLLYTPPPLDGKVGIRVTNKILVFQIYVQQVSTQGQFCSVSSSPPGNEAHL